jgi:YVTN family beta-propeller protein
LSDVAVHPDGKRVFVSAANAARMLVLDVESNRFIANVEVGAGPSNMAFTPDGSKLYVACSRSNEVSVIDTSTYKRIQNVSVGAQPYGIVISEPPNLPRDWD